MLKSVLSKLIECMTNHNEYVVQGLPSVVAHYTDKCALLIECLENAGYRPRITTESVEITEGLCRGCRDDLYVGMSFAVPGITPEDVTAFKAVGFEWLWASNRMTYKFENNRKEKEVEWVS